MISFKQMTLVHKISYQLLSKHHHIIGLHFKRHTAFANLPIDKKFTPFIFKSLLLLHEILSERMNFRLQRTSKLIKLWINDHFDNFKLIKLIGLFKNVLALLFIQFKHQHILLKAYKIIQNGIVYVFYIELLVLHINSSLKQYLLLVIEVFKNFNDFAKCKGKLFCCLTDRNFRQKFTPLIFIGILFGMTSILIIELKLILYINQSCRLKRYQIKKVLPTILCNFNLLNELINIYAILFDALAMWIHNLWANITLCTLRHTLLRWIVTIIIAASHILHLHIVGYRLLSIDLTNQRLQTFS